MIPIRDDNPHTSMPVVVIAIIAVNVAVWILELAVGTDRAILAAGLIPEEIVGRVDLVHSTLVERGDYAVVVHHQPSPLPWPGTLLSTLFMHRDWLHILGNMWFLWIFGDNVEDAMGRGRFLGFYLLCGLLATASHIAVDPHSQIPLVGASGAIAGVLGAYLFLFPKHRILTLVPLFVFLTWLHVPAWLWLGAWFVMQFVQPGGSDVAWLAHVGGFVAGVASFRLFVRKRPLQPRRVRLEYYD